MCIHVHTLYMYKQHTLYISDVNTNVHEVHVQMWQLLPRERTCMHSMYIGIKLDVHIQCTCIYTGKPVVH